MDRRKAFVLPDVERIVGDLLARPEGLPLEDYEHKIMSQHGEDGITVEVFRRVGMVDRRSVELGCGANGGNSGVLVAGLGFEGLMVDGNEEMSAITRKVFTDHRVHVQQA
jgi:hypothetical protein